MLVDGIEHETRWWGQPAPRALVFLHEGLGSIAQWRDTPEAIARAASARRNAERGEDLPAFVYARQGYGRSAPIALPRPLSYMHDEAARLPRVLAAAAIAEPILVGHSDGASIAIIATGAGHVAPRGLVLIAPHVFVEDISVESIARAADAYRDGDLRARLARYHADVDGAFWGWNRAWLDPEFRAWNLEAFLPAIAVPVLVVQGTADEYGTLAQVEAIRRQVSGPCDVLLVDGAGHAPFRDAPERVHARIAEFAAFVASR
jgi:pimeloyl-ACP methyl ester carboxylesterase